MKTIYCLIIAISLSILMLSCSSTTIINSTPTGGKLYMGGEYVGTTPHTYSDTKIVGSSTPFKITLEGYQEFNGVLVRNEQADIGAIVGGVFLLVPFLWTMEYKPTHNFELVPNTLGN